MIITSPKAAKPKIQKIGVTKELLADRGGLLPLMRFADGTKVFEEVARLLSSYRAGKKGVPVLTMIRQLAAFFFDGTSRHLSHFDRLKQDKGHHALMEEVASEIVSSHQVKRLLHKMPASIWSPMRKLLRRMFATRLRGSRPKVIELFIDTMVLDNDDAKKRQGNQPTYKKVKGFQPLQLIWEGQIIDAQFRGGSKNGNHGQTVMGMLRKALKTIRQEVGYEIPVVVRMDGGFFDGKLYRDLDVNNIGFISTGRLSTAIKEFAQQQSCWEEMDSGKQCYDFFEFGMRCKEWSQFYRGIFLRKQFEDDQMLLAHARPETVIITNMGENRGLFNGLDQELRQELFSVENLIKGHHSKGAEELTHRALKDFGFEQLPFKKYGANMTFYYLMVISFNLMEWYKRDVLTKFGLVGKGSYATTIRRVTIDFAAKIIRTSHQIIMRVTEETMKRMRLDELWKACQSPPLLV